MWNFGYIVVLILISCNHTDMDFRTGMIEIRTLDVQRSRYETDTRLMFLQVNNHSHDTLYLESIENLQGAISERVDSTSVVNVLLKHVNLNEIKTKLPGIPSVMPPSILFTDSASKLDEYYQQHLTNNKSIIRKRISDVDFWVIKPLDSVKIHSILRFPLIELTSIDTRKLNNNKSATIQLAFKLKYYESKFQTAKTTIVLTDEISDLSIVTGANPTINH